MMDNNNIFLVIKAAVVAVMGAYGAAFGWLGWLVLAWLVCMAIDWLTGTAAAASKGQWSSDTAYAGVWHKAGMIVVVIVACMADCVVQVVIGKIPGLDLQFSAFVLPIVLVWYIFTELGSIAENAAKMGAPVPAGLLKLLAAGKKLAGEQIAPDEDNEEDDLEKEELNK